MSNKIMDLGILILVILAFVANMKIETYHGFLNIALLLVLAGLLVFNYFYVVRTDDKGKKRDTVILAVVSVFIFICSVVHLVQIM